MAEYILPAGQLGSPEAVSRARHCWTGCPQRPVADPDPHSILTDKDCFCLKEKYFLFFLSDWQFISL